MPVDQVHDAIGQIAGEIWSVIFAAILLQASGHIHARKTLTQSQLDIGISLVIAKQDVEARLLLLDEVVFKRQSFFVVVDDDVLDVNRLTQQLPVLAFASPTPSWKYDRTRARKFFAFPT